MQRNPYAAPEAEVKDTDTQSRSGVYVGCLALLLGPPLGFVVAYFWSKSQVHTLGSHVVQGEGRAMIVIGHAVLGAIIGGIVVPAIALIHRKLTGGSYEREDELRNVSIANPIFLSDYSKKYGLSESDVLALVASGGLPGKEIDGLLVVEDCSPMR